MKIAELDTPTLMIDKDILTSNLKRMQDYADAQKVNLRPHDTLEIACRGKLQYICFLRFA